MIGVLEIVGGLFGIAKDALAGWQARRTLRAENELKIEAAKAEATIRHLETAQKGEIDWDNNVAGQMSGSWKDEYYVIILSIPMILCFIPGLDVYVKAGFEALDATPEWYKWAIAIAVGASFGYRRLPDVLGKLFERGK